MLESCSLINANCVVWLFLKCVFTAAAKVTIWQVFLYLLLGVSAAASWHKYVKRAAAELPFTAVKINIHT